MNFYELSPVTENGRIRRAENWRAGGVEGGSG